MSSVNNFDWINHRGATKNKHFDWAEEMGLGYLDYKNQSVKPVARVSGETIAPSVVNPKPQKNVRAAVATKSWSRVAAGPAIRCAPPTKTPAKPTTQVITSIPFIYKDPMEDLLEAIWKYTVEEQEELEACFGIQWGTSDDTNATTTINTANVPPTVSAPTASQSPIEVQAAVSPRPSPKRQSPRSKRNKVRGTKKSCKRNSANRKLEAPWLEV